MSKNLRRCMKNMHHVCDVKSRKLKNSILEEMSKKKEFFEAIYEIVNNIQAKFLKLDDLPPSELGKLKKHFFLMEQIHKRPKSKIRRKRLVKQSGGFLPIILPILTTVVGELIANVIRQKSDPDST